MWRRLLLAAALLTTVPNEAHAGEICSPTPTDGQCQTWVELLYVKLLHVVGHKHPVEEEAIDLPSNDRILQISKNSTTHTAKCKRPTPF